jgi:hypothetical protein
MNLLAYDFYQDSFSSFAVELAVKYLLPRAEIKLTAGYGHDHFPAHHAAFQVGVGVVLEAVVLILRVRLFRSQFLQPDLEVVMKPRLIVINKNAGGYVHGVTQHKAFLYAAFIQTLFNLRRDIDKFPPS